MTSGRDIASIEWDISAKNMTASRGNMTLSGVRTENEAEQKTAEVKKKKIRLTVKRIKRTTSELETVRKSAHVPVIGFSPIICSRCSLEPTYQFFVFLVLLHITSDSAIAMLSPTQDYLILCSHYNHTWNIHKKRYDQCRLIVNKMIRVQHNLSWCRPSVQNSDMISDFVHQFLPWLSE